MTVIQLLENLTNDAKKFRNDENFISRNYHLTGLKEDPKQEVTDAVLVSFINYIGMRYGVDYALYVEDLKKEN